MAYDEGLAQRLREALGDLPDVVEKRMFGGLACMWRGNMLVGVMGDDLIARVGPDGMADALKQPGARVFDFTGRPMKGWVVVAGEAVGEDADLADWIDRARDYVEPMPPK
ncbi:TfoX/Sxy family protein [Lentzea tibetensis]|uniref:TfoX/Sxy family protein n=1 Tax=Lentzea tibetensis TaxID=2591470 RepID=A0A563EXL8_9PSEU|nr:TfoX/Sxy family protein [Lentzea tibetensis]TWP52302.1 TfoX/Sxy family protein [Lentzea tibetensis]